MSDLKNKKTSELLDILQDEDLQDDYRESLIVELRGRFPFDYIFNTMEANEESITTIKKEFGNHIHVNDGVYIKKK